MNEIDEALCEGLQEREGQTGATITWPIGGTEYPCSGGPMTGGKRLDQGGFKPFNDTRIQVRKAVFEWTTPAEKQKLGYKAGPAATAIVLRIEAINKLTDEVWEFECNVPDRGV